MAGVDPDSIKTHVCLLGLSYIRRLSDIMISNKNLLNINLDDDRYKISVCVRGGLRTYDLHQIIRDVAGTPTIFIMQIGGTDIGLLPNELIATNIVLFFRISDIWPRDKSGDYRTASAKGSFCECSRTTIT